MKRLTQVLNPDIRYDMAKRKITPRTIMNQMTEIAMAKSNYEQAVRHYPNNADWQERQRGVWESYSCCTLYPK